jgi:hypothetical protein
LKYFYLLFSPVDLLPLDQIVLNTEAHPFPRFDASKKRFKTGWERLPRDKEGNVVYEKKTGEEKVEEKPKVEEKKEVVGEKKGDQIKMGDTVAMR